MNHLPRTRVIYHENWFFYVSFDTLSSLSASLGRKTWDHLTYKKICNSVGLLCLVWCLGMSGKYMRRGGCEQGLWLWSLIRTNPPGRSVLGKSLWRSLGSQSDSLETLCLFTPLERLRSRSNPATNFCSRIQNMSFSLKGSIWGLLWWPPS